MPPPLLSGEAGELKLPSSVSFKSLNYLVFYLVSFILHPCWHGFCCNWVKNSYLYEVSFLYFHFYFLVFLCIVGVRYSGTTFLRVLPLHPATHPRGDSPQADRDAGTRLEYKGLNADRYYLPYSSPLCAPPPSEQYASRTFGARAADVQ